MIFEEWAKITVMQQALAMGVQLSPADLDWLNKRKPTLRIKGSVQAGCALLQFCDWNVAATARIIEKKRVFKLVKPGDDEDRGIPVVFVDKPPEHENYNVTHPGLEKLCAEVPGLYLVTIPGMLCIRADEVLSIPLTRGNRGMPDYHQVGRTRLMALDQMIPVPKNDEWFGGRLFAGLQTE